MRLLISHWPDARKWLMEFVKNKKNGKML